MGRSDISQRGTRQVGHGSHTEHVRALRRHRNLSERSYFHAFILQKNELKSLSDALKTHGWFLKTHCLATSGLLWPVSPA